MDEVKLDGNLKCDECGRHGVVDFGERKLCLNCHETCGSCCPEFGREELAED